MKNNINLPKMIQEVSAEPVFEPLMLRWTLLRGRDQTNKYDRNVTNTEREVWSNVQIVSGNGSVNFSVLVITQTY